MGTLVTALVVLVVLMLIRVGRLSKGLRELEVRRRRDFDHFACLLGGIERDVLSMDRWIQERIRRDAELN